MKEIRRLAENAPCRAASSAAAALALMLLAPAVSAVEETGGIPVPMPRPEQAAPNGEGADAGSADRPDAGRPAPAGIDPADVIVPEPRPERAADDRARKESGEPATDPATAGEMAPETQPLDDQGGKPSLMSPPRPAKMPAGEMACRARLTELGVTFEELPQLADESGCSVPWPISVTSLSRTVGLAPAAQLNCATALAAAEFVAGTIAPKAREVFGAELVAMRQDSAYVCRPRNGTTKLSEHAFGNALDIGAFALSDERRIAVGSAAGPDEAAFMLAVRLAACGPFRTVLGPGSDTDHATHFHFDLARRRSGSTFCQ